MRTLMVRTSTSKSLSFEMHTPTRSSISSASSSMDALSLVGDFSSDSSSFAATLSSSDRACHAFSHWLLSSSVKACQYASLDCKATGAEGRSRKADDP